MAYLLSLQLDRLACKLHCARHESDLSRNVQCVSSFYCLAVRTEGARGLRCVDHSLACNDFITSSVRNFRLPRLPLQNHEMYELSDINESSVFLRREHSNKKGFSLGFAREYVSDFDHGICTKLI